MNERIVYVSRAAPGIVERDAYDIIRVSHNRNSRFGLTGALILLDGYFLQVLEGDAHRLRERYQRIVADPRHSHIVKRQAITTSRRCFPTEWMALRHGDAVSEATRRAFDYAPGYPQARFDGERLVAFALACCLAAAEQPATPA